MTNRYCHYDKDTFEITGFYSEKAHGENIPSPCVLISLDEINQVNEQQYTHVTIENDVIVGFEQRAPVLTEAEILNLAISSRKKAYATESDPLYMEWKFDGTPEAEQSWRDKVAEIKQRYPLS